MDLATLGIVDPKDPVENPNVSSSAVLQGIVRFSTDQSFLVGEVNSGRHVEYVQFERAWIKPTRPVTE